MRKNNNKYLLTKLVRSIVLYFLQISLMTILTEDSWILLASSVFNLLQYAVLVEEHEDQASHNYISEKEGSAFIAFSDY